MASSITSTSLVEQQLNVSDSTVIGTIVDGVNEAIENFLDETISETTYTNEEYDVDRKSHWLVLHHRPVTTFTRLQEKDSPSDFDDDSWTTIDTDEYTVYTASGLVYWNGEFQPGRKRYRATYDAGYASIPNDLQLAATKIASSLYQNRSTGNIETETLGQYSRTFAIDPTNLRKLGVDWILEKYKNRFSNAFSRRG